MSPTRDGLRSGEPRVARVDAVSESRPEEEAPATSGALVRSSAIIAVGTGLSRLTGMLRVVALAAVLGGGGLADAYNLANVTPNIIYELLVGGVLSATLIPIFVQAWREGDDDGPSAIFSTAVVALVAISVLAVLAAPWLARIYGTRLAGSAAAAQRDLVVPFLHLVLPEIFLYGVVALTTAALNARRRFVAAAFAPVLNNLVLIVVLITLAARYDGPTAIAGDAAAKVILGLGTTAGIAAMAGAQVFATARTGIRLRWAPSLRHPAVRRVARLSGWTLGYVAANQVALLIVLALANGSGPGSVTAYQNAFVYLQLPHGLVAVSVMTAFLPELSEAYAARDKARFGQRFLHGGELMGVLVIPAAVALVVLARPVVTFFLGHGSYSPVATAEAGRTLAAFAWGLPGFSLYLYALRGFYARTDTRTPFLLNLGENGLNVALAIPLASRGAPGLALAYAIAYSIAGVGAAIALHRRVGGFGRETAPTLRGLTGVAVSSVAMAVVLLGLRSLLPTGGSGAALATLAVAVPVGGAVYVAVAWGLGVYLVRNGVQAVAGRIGLRSARR